MTLTTLQEIRNLISHELKTPTVPIIGYCEMLLNPNFGLSNISQYPIIGTVGVFSS